MGTKQQDAKRTIFFVGGACSSTAAAVMGGLVGVVTFLKGDSHIVGAFVCMFTSALFAVFAVLCLCGVIINSARLPARD